MTAGVYQGLTILPTDSPSVNKHCVNLIAIAGQQLVPLTVALGEYGGDSDQQFIYLT